MAMAMAMAMETEPGRWLVTHKAPDRLLERALTAPPPRDWKPIAAMAACLLLGVGLGRLTVGPQEASPDEPVEIVATQERVPVRLVIHAPEASTAGIAGTWNDWDFGTTPMTRGDDGTFHATVLLDRGQHEYMFVLDGHTWRTDPSATLTRDDGFGNANAVIEL